MPDPGSEQGARHTGTTGRRRLLEALVRARRGQIVVAVLLATLGFGAVLQVRTNDDDASYAGYREQDLIQVLNGLAGTSQRAQSEISRLQQSRAQLESDTSKRQAALDQANTQDTTLRILAGLVPVTGPGIRITITEATATVNVDSFIDLIEELRSAGAEAMQINGKARLVAQSSFGQGADGLYVDHQLLTPPYIIDVIGEPAALAGAVTFARGPQDEFAADGAQMRVSEVPSLDITSVRKDTGQ